MNGQGRLIDILVFCVAGFFIPVILIFFELENVKERSVSVSAELFAETVCTKGYIDTVMYESFLSELNAAGILVTTEFNVEHDTFAPEYMMRTIEDAEDYLDGLYGGENELHQDNVVTVRPPVVDPGTPPEGCIEGDVVNGTDTSGPDAEHTHTSGCYLGHNHTASGCTRHSHGSGCYCSGSYTSSTYLGSSYCGTYSNQLFRTCYASLVKHNVTTTTSGYSIGQTCDYCGHQYKSSSTKVVTSCSDCGTSNTYKYNYCPSCGKQQTSGSPGGCTLYKCPNGHGNYSSSGYCSYIYPCGSTYVKHSGTYSRTEHYALSQTCDYSDCRYVYTSSSTKVLTYCSDCDALLSDVRSNNCPSCGRGQSWSSGSGVCTGYKCPSGHGNVSGPGTCNVRTIAYGCTGCGATSSSSGGSHYRSNYSYSCNRCGSAGSYYGGSCGRLLCSSSSYDCAYANAAEDVTPDCNKIVTALTPIVEQQVLNAGETPDIRAKVTFADGHSEIVNCTVSGFQSTSYNTVQNITLSYGSYAGSLSNPGKTDCSVKLTVHYPLKTCENGHLYYLVNGDDTLCTYCMEYPETLEVIGAEEPFCITKGTTLSENGIAIKVIYYDGHHIIIDSGWTDNLDLNYVGEQTVVIGYQGAETTLLVNSTRVKSTCSVCGYEYSLYPDNSDPGCPKCLSAIPVFTGNVLKYKETISYGEILDELYHGDRICYFSRGDRFRMQIWKNGFSVTDRIFGMLYHTSPQKELISMYSVNIRDEKVQK